MPAMPFHCPDCGSYDRPRDGRRGDCRYFESRPEWAASGVDPPCSLYDDPAPASRRRRIVLAVLSLAAVLTLLWAVYQPAWSQDRGAWFKSLKDASGRSCCDISDCQRTEAKWEGDGWTAVVNGAWRSIPASKVLRKPHSIDGDAYVCNGPDLNFDEDGGGKMPGIIHCFVPPDIGY